MKRKSFRWQLLFSILKSGVIAFCIAIIGSLLFFYPFLRNNAIKSAENVNTTVLQHIESTLTFAEGYTENIAAAVEQNRDIQNYLGNPTDTNKTRASVALNNLCSYMGMVRGIALASPEVSTIDSMTNFTEEDYKLLENEFSRQMQTGTFSRSYSRVYQVRIGTADYMSVAYARNFYLNNRWCTIVMYINLNNMLNDIKTLVGEALDAYYLTDSMGQEFYSAGNEKDVQEAMSVVDDADIDQRESVNGDIIFSKKTTGSGYGIVSMVKSHSIFAVLMPYTAGLFLAMLLFLLLTMSITLRNVNAMINPVIELSHHMLRAAGGDLECKVETTREDEIGQLETSFNKMLDDLKESIEVISEKEAREQQIKFSLLVSQIDPHFIYNTINSINYLARKERCEDIVKVNTALIAILRDRLRVNDIQITDTVANEMRVVNQYLVIEKFMYGGNLETIWDVDNELMEEQIPKNMIQPLVENSLFHGLIDEENGEFNGTITIHIHRDEEQNIVLCVEDDGLGMDEEKLKQVQNTQFNPENRGSKIGLANIRGRLYYLYDNADCMRIESGQEKGTKISIIFSN